MMIEHDEEDSIGLPAQAAPLWPAKWRRQHYRAVAAGLNFGNQSQSRPPLAVAVYRTRGQHAAVPSAQRATQEKPGRRNGG